MSNVEARTRRSPHHRRRRVGGPLGERPVVVARHHHPASGKGRNHQRATDATGAVHHRIECWINPCVGHEAKHRVGGHERAVLSEHPAPIEVNRRRDVSPARLTEGGGTTELRSAANVDDLPSTANDRHRSDQIAAPDSRESNSGARFDVRHYGATRRGPRGKAAVEHRDVGVAEKRQQPRRVPLLTPSSQAIAVHQRRPTVLDPELRYVGFQTAQVRHNPSAGGAISGRFLPSVEAGTWQVPLSKCCGAAGIHHARPAMDQGRCGSSIHEPDERTHRQRVGVGTLAVNEKLSNGRSVCTLEGER